MTTEADHPLQGISQYQTSQFEAALQSWQQALSLYQASLDLRRQGAALGNLGAAYQALGIYTSDRVVKSLSIAQQIKTVSVRGMRSEPVLTGAG